MLLIDTYLCIYIYILKKCVYVCMRDLPSLQAIILFILTGVVTAMNNEGHKLCD